MRTSCGAVDEEVKQAIEILRAELAADGTVCCAAPHATANVVLTPLPCSSPGAVEASIQKGDGPPVRRLISLHDVHETARARVIALAVAESLRSEAPLTAAAPEGNAARAQAAAPAAAAAPPPPAASVTVPAPVDRATASSVTGSAVAPWSFETGVGVAARVYPFTATTLSGLGAFAALGPGEGAWRLRLAVEGSRTSTHEPEGEVSLRAGWATLALARRARWRSVRFGWGPQLEVAWGQVRGQVSSPGVGAGEGSHGLVALGAQGEATLPLGHGFLAWTALGVSELLGGLDATVDDRRVLGARYLQLALSFG
ncbi:MAG TPA: hypothetical protein VIU64_08945, partial [Polyangia bacterium]